MRIIHSLEEYLNENDTKPMILTIGNFDGVHLGHQAVIALVKKYTKKFRGNSTILSFANHPSEIIRPEIPMQQLCTFKHKVRLLEQQHVDTLILLTFSKEFSEQTAENFLQRLREKLPFSHLILGYDATLGKNQQGNRNNIQKLSQALNFQVEYVAELSYQDSPISSSQIRKLVKEGNLARVDQLLGRKYSIYSTVIPGLQNGSKIGFPTANIDVGGLCLPPFGVYAVRVICNGTSMDGVANLGLAPTLKPEAKPVLEIFLFDTNENLYGKEVEVIPYAFLRPEKKFPSTEALQQQIAIDIQETKKKISEGYPGFLCT